MLTLCASLWSSAELRAPAQNIAGGSKVNAQLERVRSRITMLKWQVQKSIEECNDAGYPDLAIEAKARLFAYDGALMIIEEESRK